MVVVSVGKLIMGGPVWSGSEYVMPGYQSSATGGHYIGPGQAQSGVVTAWATCRQSDWDGRQCQKARDSRCSSLDPPGSEYRGDHQ